jgi:hypothetical protein
MEPRSRAAAESRARSKRGDRAKRAERWGDTAIAIGTNCPARPFSAPARRAGKRRENRPPCAEPLGSVIDGESSFEARFRRVASSVEHEKFELRSRGAV